MTLSQGQQAKWEDDKNVHRIELFLARLDLLHGHEQHFVHRHPECRVGEHSVWFSEFFAWKGTACLPCYLNQEHRHLVRLEIQVRGAKLTENIIPLQALTRTQGNKSNKFMQGKITCSLCLLGQDIVLDMCCWINSLLEISVGPVRELWGTPGVEFMNL